MKKILVFLVSILYGASTYCQLSSNALHFDGVDDVVSAQPSLSVGNLGSGGVTIEAWVNDEHPVTGSFNEILFMNYTPPDFVPPGNGFYLMLVNGQVCAQFHEQSFVQQFFPAGPDLRDNQCHHIAVVRNIDTLSAFVDGNFIGAFYSAVAPLSAQSNIVIGSYFKGLMKELRVWNVARTQNQIQSNMNVVLDGSANPNLVAYWRMNEGAGQTVTDYSSAWPAPANGSLGLSEVAESQDPAWTIGCPACALPAATISAGGPITFCSGSSVTLNANTGAGLTYQWKLNGGTIAGATASSYSATAAGSYVCIVTNSCGNATSNTINVVVNIAPTAVITAGGSTSICIGNSVTLNANTGTGLTYQWKLNGGTIPGATGSSYSATAAGSYVCIVTNSCGNVTSNAIFVVVNIAPPATITAGGSTTICTGNSVTLNANTGPVTYQWKLNGVAIPGATSSSYIASAPGNYTCVVSNSCGNVTSNTINVVVNTAPTATITAGGSTTICIGNSVTLNANTGAGLGYQWKLNGGTIAGATSSSYSATTAGNYTCVVANSCGNATSNAISVVQGPAIPSTPSQIAGVVHPCPGNNGVVYSISAVSGATSYHWTVPVTATIASGQGTMSIVVNFSSTFASGTIAVTAGNVCGNSGPRNKSVTKLPSCSTPVIQVFYPRIAGSDSATDENLFSAEVFPNPSNNYFTVKITSPDKWKCLFIIQDILGREMERRENVSVDENINFGYQLVSGIYFVEIIQGDLKKVLRIVKSE